MQFSDYFPADFSPKEYLEHSKPIPVIPAYSVMHRGTPRIAFRCPFCEQDHRHGDTENGLEMRVSDVFDSRCPWVGRGYYLFVVGSVKSLDKLPRMTPAQAALIISSLTAGLSMLSPRLQDFDGDASHDDGKLAKISAHLAALHEKSACDD